MLDWIKYFVKQCEVIDDRTIRIRVDSPWLVANLVIEIERSSRLARALLMDLCEGNIVPRNRGTQHK